MSEKVYVACLISRGAFDEERSFEVRGVDGSVWTGLAPAVYFRGRDRKPLSRRRLSSQRIPGWVAGRVIDREDGKATVTVPWDGLVTVAESMLERRSERLPVAS